MAPSNASAVLSQTHGGIIWTQIDITWQDNSKNETGFEVHRSTTGPSGTFTVFAGAGANVGAYRDHGMFEPQTQFCYRVRAVRAGPGPTTYSAFSNTTCATIPPLPIFPPGSASVAYAVESSGGSVALSWADPGNEDGFRIYRSSDGGAVWTLAGSVGANITSWVTQQQVCYRVVAFNAGGDAPPSNTACTLPAAPTNLTLNWVGPDAVEYAWEDNSAIEDSYEVWLDFWYFSCSGDSGATGGTEVLVRLPANATTANSARIPRDSDFPCGAYVQVWVTATRNGHSSYSAPVSVP